MHVPRRGGGESKARKPPSAGSVRTLFKSVPEEDEEQEVLSGEEKCARRHSIADEMDDGIDISRSTTNPDSPLAMASPDYHLAKRYSISSPATRRASINSISSSTRRGAWERVTMPAPFVKQRAMSDLWQEMGSYRTNGYSMQNLADSIENIRRENAHRQYARISRVSHHTVVGYKHKVKDQPSEDRYAIHDSLTPDPLPFLSDCDDDEDDDAGPLGTFSMFAVFDGHGGGNCADFLSKSCGHVLASEPVLWDEDLVAFERLAVATTSTFLTLENRHCEWAQDSEDLSGSTAIMGSYADGVLVMAAIGDSQGVFVDHKKQLRTLCPAHTVDNPKEVERVISQGGFIKNGRVGGIMMPTRAIGDLDCKQAFGECLSPHPEIALAPVYSPDPLSKKEQAPFCILASDGLWDVMSAKNAVDVARSAMKRREKDQDVNIAEALIQVAVAKLSRDDITCIVVEWQ